MSLDPYSSCPCGSGKKFKWCCQPIYGGIQQAWQLENNGQHEAALKAMDQVVQQHGGNPEAWGQKALLLASLPFLDEAWERSLPGDVIAAVLNVANWRFLFADRSYAELFASPSPVLHFWSLAIEEQFYWVFPLLTAGVFAVAKGSLRVYAAVLGGLLVLSGVLTLLFRDSPQPTVTTPGVSVKIDAKTTKILTDGYFVASKKFGPMRTSAGVMQGTIGDLAANMSEFLTPEALKFYLRDNTGTQVVSRTIPFFSTFYLYKPDYPIGVEVMSRFMTPYPTAPARTATANFGCSAI